MASNERGAIHNIQALALIVDGKQIGTNVITQRQEGGLIFTTDTMEFTTRQKGQKRITSTVVTEYIEDINLKPVSIVKKVNVPNLSYSTSAVVDGVELEVTRKDAHSTYVERFPIAENFLLYEGIKKSLADAAKTNETKVHYSAWDFTANDFGEVLLKLIQLEESTTSKHWKVEKKTYALGEVEFSVFYTDKNFNYTEASYELAGKIFQLAACEGGCDKKSNEPFNNFSARFLDSPYRIPEDAREGAIRYILAYRGEHALTLPNTADQKVLEANGEIFVIDVCLSCEKETDELNVAYLRNNMWVQSEHPDIQKEAKRRAKNKYTDHKKMKKLTHYVERHMSGDIQYLGYGTALDAYEQKLGDCTEFALLLTALARSVDIPARVAIGFAYSEEEIEDKKHVFVPHAWVQAYVDGAWRNYDAALGDVDAGYITLGVTDGSMPSFLKIARKMNYFDIVGVSQIVNTRQVVEHASRM